MYSRFFCTTLLLGICNPAFAANFWLSTSGDPIQGSTPPLNPGAVPVVSHSAGVTTASIYIWARPDAGKTLANWSLNLVATDPNVLTFTDSDVSSYNVVVDDPDPNNVFVRWEAFNEPSGDSTALEDLKGFNLAGLGTPLTGISIGPQSTGVPFDDPFYDSTNDSWLLAKVDYMLTGSIGSSTDLFLQIGDDGMQNSSSDPNIIFEDSSLTSAVFGAVTDPNLNASLERNTNSLTKDATISIVSFVPDADFDGNNLVDGIDFLTMQRNLGITSGATPSQGDANNDSAVNGLDLGIWEQQYGGPPPLSVNQAPVPEPASAVLSLMAFCLLVRMRQRMAIEGNHV